MVQSALKLMIHSGTVKVPSTSVTSSGAVMSRVSSWVKNRVPREDTSTSPGMPMKDGSNRLALLLAMAMFVLVIDTSLMNVSISAVVEDLDTTVSGVQSAIALEALVSAAFILIGSKMGDLFGRKRAYVLGLLGYAIGALAMTLAQGLTAIIIFWAILGGLGASDEIFNDLLSHWPTGKKARARQAGVSSPRARR